MDNDNVIPLERKLCEICATEYTSGNPLIEGTLGLVFKKHAKIVLAEPCPECQKWIDKGYIGLIEFDPEKTKFINRETMTVRAGEAYRTGRLLWVHQAYLPILFPDISEKGVSDGFVYADKNYIAEVEPLISRGKKSRPDTEADESSE